MSLAIEHHFIIMNGSATQRDVLAPEPKMSPFCWVIVEGLPPILDTWQPFLRSRGQHDSEFPGRC